MDGTNIKPISVNYVENVKNVKNKPALSNNTTQSKNQEKIREDSGNNIKSTENLTEIVVKVNGFVKSFSTKISFDVDNESEQSIITVSDKETGKIIRQIPPEEILRLSKMMDEISGIIFDRRI